MQQKFGEKFKRISRISKQIVNKYAEYENMQINTQLNMQKKYV